MFKNVVAQFIGQPGLINQQLQNVEVKNSKDNEDKSEAKARVKRKQPRTKSDCKRTSA